MGVVIETAATPVASVIVAYLTARFALNRDMARLREERKLDYSIEDAIQHLLNHPEHKKRSLKHIRYR